MINTGAQWPPDSDRIAKYGDYQALYEGEHINVSVINRNHDRRRKDMGPDADTYLVHDFPRLIVNIPTNLLVSKPPVISYPADSPEAEALAGIMQRSRWQKVLLEGVQGTSALGDGVLVVSGAPGSVKIEAKPAYCYFPDIDPDNAKQALAESLAWEREWDGDTVIRVDRYLQGSIQREAFSLDGVSIGAKFSEAELEQMVGGPVVVSTGIPDKNTLIHIANNPSSSSYFGRSDLGGGLLTLFDEYNERASQMARILDKHASPKMAGPRLHLGPDGKLRLLDYFETVDGTAPKYITWDAQLQAGFSHLDRVRQNIFAFSEVAEALAYLMQGARYDSAPAAQMQFAQTLAKVARNRMYWDYGLNEAFRIAVAIELGQTFEETPEPDIRWRDGLPKDLSQDANTEATRLASGTTSLVDAIQRLDDCDESSARHTLENRKCEKEEFGGGEPPPQNDPEEVEPDSNETGSFISGSEE